MDFVGQAMNFMETAAEIDNRYKEMFESISNSFYLLEDTASALRNELDLLEFDPHRLDEIETRLNEINQLKRKYGFTVGDILEYLEKIKKNQSQSSTETAGLNSSKRNGHPLGKKS